MNDLGMAAALMGAPRSNPGQTTTVYGVASSDSQNGLVLIDLGGDTVSPDDNQSIECETTFKVYEGDEVIVSLIGADGSGKTPIVVGIVGRGDQQQDQIDAIKNYFWTDQYGAHVSTEAGSVNGANVLLDSDSLDIRVGASNSEADQTVLASFGTEVTVGSRGVGAVGTYSQVFGIGCVASGNYSHAEGDRSVASGDYAHSEGQISTASGNFSHTEGFNTKATDQNAHAEGFNAIASDFAAHAEGSYTTASGDSSHAEGSHTTASGANAHAEGKWCVASAGFSHAEGLGTIAKSDAIHVQGKYNSTLYYGLYIDVVGNGTSDNNRSNAYNLETGGNAEFQGEVYVGGCTPNGETPYPVIRYNTSTAQSEYYDSGTSTWTQVPGGGGGGGLTLKLLWTNPNPTTAYAAATVTLDLSGYEAVLIKTLNDRTSNTPQYHSELVFVGDSSVCYSSNANTTAYQYKRQADVSSSGVTFGGGFRNTSAGNNYAIPQKIYGIKGIT